MNNMADDILDLTTIGVLDLPPTVCFNPEFLSRPEFVSSQSQKSDSLCPG